MRVLVVGGGHNGLVSAAHNIINATDIVADLRLRAAGLEYREMDPFSVAVFADGATVRFHRDVAATVASIAEIDPAEALLARLLVSPYARVLTERLGSDLVRAPVSAFAAHASAAPQAPGSAVFALWQALYHQVGQWHAVGGSQGLVDALAQRFASYGGSWRTGAAVARITRAGDQVTGVELESGEHLSADAVLTTLNPHTALLELLDPPLGGPEADRLRGAHWGRWMRISAVCRARQTR